MKINKKKLYLYFKGLLLIIIAICMIIFLISSLLAEDDSYEKLESFIYMWFSMWLATLVLEE